MEPKISTQIEDIRIEIDSLIKKVNEKYGLSQQWSDLCAVKDKLGSIYISLVELES